VRAVSPVSKLVRFAAPLGVLVCALSTWLSAGCGGDTKTTICEAQCECAKSCNDAATEACTKAITASITLAETKGCNSKGEADTFFDCEADRATCAAGGYNTDSCLAEKQVFFQCLSLAQCSFVSSGNAVDCPP
jgi:hypothetical protein